MKNRNWFWGLFFVLAAFFVIGSQVGAFIEIGFWSITATVVLAALFIYSLIKLNYFSIFVSLALLYKIYTNVFGFPDISIWILLLAAILASVGFYFLFNKHPKWKCSNHGHSHNFKHSIENMDDNHPCAKASFGASSKYLHGDCLEKGEFTASFGALEIYFDQALLSPSGAEIFLDCSFGAIKLYVPRLWQVKDNLEASVGAVDNKRIAQPDENFPILTINGNVRFGAVEIHYI